MRGWESGGKRRILLTEAARKAMLFAAAPPAGIGRSPRGRGKFRTGDTRHWKSPLVSGITIRRNGGTTRVRCGARGRKSHRAR
jgi:hypothetical protein